MTPRAGEGLAKLPGGRRVLVLSPFPPRLDASHGGARAIAQWIRAAAERQEVGLLYLRGPYDEPVGPAVRESCAFADEVGRPAPASGGQRSGQGRDGIHVARWAAALPRRLRLVALMIAGTPSWPARYRVEAFAERLAHRVSSWRPHVVEAHFHLTAQYLGGGVGEGADRPRRVFVCHEPGLDHTRAGAAAKGPLRRLLARGEARMWRRFERRLLDDADATIAFTVRDRDMLAGLRGAAPVVRVPLGIDLPDRPLDPAGGTPPRIVFVGDHVHPPNADAALRLARSIFPPLRASRPDLGLDIVGPHPPPELTGLGGEGIVVHGFVPDVRPHLDRAAVVAVPVRLGGGTRVKVLEALAAGKAVVASPIALEGIDAPPRECVVVAERDEDFVREIGTLLDDPGRRRELATAARGWALENLGWERSIPAREALYDELLRPASPSPDPGVGSAARGLAGATTRRPG